MLVKRDIRTADSHPVTMDGAKDVAMRMMVGRGDGALNFSLRHFTVKPGGHTPRHRHNYEHENYIISGRGQVWYYDRFHDIKPGETLFIEPNVEHQFVSSTDEPLEFLCLVPASFDCGDGTVKPTPGS
jgi:quercetin dioxygenase-like cupin family protein